MGLYELHTYVIECDGAKPNGERCPCDIKTEAATEDEAEQYGGG